MRDTKSLFKSIFETSIQPIIVIDVYGIVKEYNTAAEKLFKYTAKEVIGKNIKKLMPFDIAKTHDGYLSHYKKTHEAHITGKGRKIKARKKDGSLVDFFLSLSEVQYDGQRFYAGILQDITQEIKLQEANQKLIDFNLSIIQQLEKTNDYQELIENILLHFAKLFDFEVGHFYEYDHYQDHLKSSSLFFIGPPRKYKHFIEITKKTTFKKGIGLPGLAWKKEGVVYYEDVERAKNFPRAKLSNTPLKVKGGLALPVMYNKKLLGVIEFFSDKELKTDGEQLELFERFSKVISGLYGQYQEGRTLNLLLENCGEGVYGLDSKGITTFVNPRACEILEYEADELIGYSMHKKIHYAYSDGRPYPQSACNVYECIKTNNPLYIDNEVFWSKSGKAVPVEYTVTPIIENKNIIGGVVTFIDISEKKKVTRHLEVISKLQERYIQGQSKKELFDEMLNHLIQCTGSEYGFIGAVLTDELGVPYLKTYSITNIAWNKKMRALYEKSLPDGLEFGNLNTLFGYTMKTGQAVISNNPVHDKRAGGLPKGHPPLDAYLGIPVFASGGQLVAMYGLANRPGGYSKDNIQELKVLTNAISSVIESSRHYNVIKEMARFDALTKIYNRQHFDLKFNELIEKHRKKGGHFCILMLDLNKFKNINDTYGHQIGDEVLIMFTQRMIRLLKKDDIIARIGGDEFIIILQNIKDADYATQVAARLSKATDKVYKVHAKEIYCSISIGIACYPVSGKTAQTLLKHVDFALYDAKNKRAKWQMYSKGIDKQYTSMMVLEEKLTHAFQDEAYYLVYQPQVDLKTKQVVGLEALLRFKYPFKKEISPGVFIPILEKFGNSEKLNVYVVKHVLRDVILLNNKKPLKIAINISPKVSKIDTHIQELVEIVKQSKAALDKQQIIIEFEITESSFTYGSSNLLSKALDITRKAGISCAMDDFGVEYSSISRLTQYPFDMVKIDLFFIQKLDKKQNKAAKAVIKALIQLASDLDFIILAEGPETKEQVNSLIEMGCQYAQGFYFYKPMTIKKINRIIE